MSEIKSFDYSLPFQLESGELLSGFSLVYQTFGKLNHDHSNVVWIIHALTANSNPIEWWPGVVGDGEVIDPRKHFIICANSLCSHYGSTSPLSINPDTNEKYYHDFPLITNRDVVNTLIALRKHLGIKRINTLVGASLGGQQAMEWAISEPHIFDNLILIATNAKHSPYGIAFNESQRLSIEADSTWKTKADDAGLAGLKAARSIALLSYRTYNGYAQKQKDNSDRLDDYKASSYQNYQGEKLINRFNAFSYWALTKAMDSHNVGRGRNSVEDALKKIKANTSVIGIESDMLFPIEEQKFLSHNIHRSTYYQISSDYGHDGFLIERENMSAIIKKAMTLEH